VNETTVVLLALLILFLFLSFGMEVGFSLAIAGFVGLNLGWGSDVAMGYLNTTPFRYAASFSLAMIPLFMLMGTYSSEGGIATMLFNTAQKWLGDVRGGLAMAVMVACAIFSAASGSSSACAATFTPICYPQMVRLKYDKALSLGAIAVAGTLDIMIPPSITLVFYGLLTGTSIAKLYIAGIIPGIILTLAYSLTVWVLVKRNPALAPEVTRSTWRERVVSLKDTWAIITLILLCLGTLYMGIVTPTEAAALGAGGALIIGLVWRTITPSGFLKAAVGAAHVTAMIFMIIIGAFIFGYVMTLGNVTPGLIALVKNAGFSPWVIMTIILIFYIILGCFMDQLAIQALTLPVVFPLVTSLGFDPVWFGVIIVLTAEIGILTPPLGLNVYVVKAVSKEPLSLVFRGVYPYLVTDGVILVLLCVFPQLALYLPGTMGG